MKNIMNYFHGSIVTKNNNYKIITKKQRILNVLENYKIIRNVRQMKILKKKETNSQFLVLFACHSSSAIKFETIKTNLLFLKQNKNIQIHVMNSTNTTFSNQVKNFCVFYNINYFEADNNSLFDFGKWYNLLHLVDYNQFDHIVFANDSVIFQNNLSHFFNSIALKNVDLFGYNDSIQPRHHYQSYLFSIKTTAISKFKIFVEEKMNQIKSQDDVINNYEIKMTDHFLNHDCFLKLSKITKIPSNIFFTNDDLYIKLLKTQLLPFLKVKRIENIWQNKNKKKQTTKKLLLHF
jgi:hypothetical protein